MNTDLLYERDAVLTWLQKVREPEGPTRHRLFDLLTDYDETAELWGLPEIDTTLRLGRHLTALGLERWRDMSSRGYVISRAPDLYLQAGRSLRSAFRFAGVALGGPWPREQVHPTYRQWLIESDLGIRALTEPWLLHVLSLHGLSVTDTHVTFTGRPS